MSYQFPTIKIELQHMQQSITTALLDYDEQMETYVNSELQRIVDNFDYAAVIEETATRAIHEAVTKGVKDFFSYGVGWKLIQSMIAEKLIGITKEDE